VGGFTEASKRHVVHILLPKGARLLFRVNGKTFIDFTVADGAVVYEGQPLLDKGALYVTRAFALSYVKGSGARSKPEITSSPSGHHFVTPYGLRSHMTRHSVISLASPSAQCCNGMALASFKVTVMPDGSLASIEARSASDDLARKLVPMLTGFKLKPFIMNGAPVEADGILTIAASTSGEYYFIP